MQTNKGDQPFGKLPRNILYYNNEIKHIAGNRGGREGDWIPSVGKGAGSMNQDVHISCFFT